MLPLVLCGLVADDDSTSSLSERTALSLRWYARAIDITVPIPPKTPKIPTTHTAITTLPLLAALVFVVLCEEARVIFISSCGMA